MKSLVLFLCVFIFFLISGLSQQAASNNITPHVFFVKDSLQIIPHSWKIISYEVSLLKNYGYLVGPYVYTPGAVSQQVIDNSQKAINLIYVAEYGDKLFFEEIKTKDPTGKIRNMASIVVKVDK